MPLSRLISPTVGWSYRLLLKPILFQTDPEMIHDRALALGRWFGAGPRRRAFVSLCFNYAHPMLTQRLAGIDFPSPVGLAAGFDKNAKLINVLDTLGFGFAEIGSVTGRACDGNKKPRLWRYKESRSLAVYYGLANEGAAAIAEKVRQSKREIPLGISIAKTNDALTDDSERAIEDYVTAYQAIENEADYIAINISCPNTSGGQPFTDPVLLERLLSAIGLIAHGKPIFIKLSPDLEEARLDQLLEVIARHRISGLICSNLTHSREQLTDEEKHSEAKGGISGKALEERANELLKKVYQKTKGKYILIGCGGIFSAEDAYTKIRLGASLLQLITGMIFEGPQLINEINRGLVKLLKQDGFTHISQAIGKDAR